MSISRSSILGGLLFCVVIIGLVLLIEEEELTKTNAYENSYTSSSVVFKPPTKDFEQSFQIPKMDNNASQIPDSEASTYKMREKKLRNSRRNPIFRTRELDYIESLPWEKRLWYTMKLLEKYPKKDRQPLYYNKTDPKLIYEVDDEAFSGGGFGSVFFATRKEDDVQVVIKAGRIDKSGGQNHLTTEATVMSYCNHPNILKSLDIFIFEQKDSSEELSGGIWLVLPFMDGGPLSQFVRSKAFSKKKWSFTEPQMAFAAKEMLSGIYYMHKREMFHRDLKLHNILIGMDGTIVIADFGFAHFKWKGSTNSFPGTLYWQAPEILREENYDLAVDIWAFGIMMRELSEGRAPYSRDKLTEVDFIDKIVNVGAPDFYEPNLWSKDFINFTMSALIYDKNERWTATQLLQHPWLKKACSKEEFSMALKNGTAIIDIEG